MKTGITLVNLKKEPTARFDIYIGRENSFVELAASKWGNPFVMKNEGDRERVLNEYRNYILTTPELYDSLDELYGKILGCWCYPKTCHGNILIELLEKKMETKDILLIRNFLSDEEANKSFAFLLDNISWKNILKTDEGVDRKINRKMSYVFDSLVNYRYTNLNLPGELWNDDLLKIKNEIFNRTGFDTNSVLLNLYEDGKDEIRWHSDKEDVLGDSPIIPMINLGASRTFWMKNKETGETIGYKLNNGDLFVMLADCQKNWLHGILKEKEVKEPRISLTFRKVFY